MKCLINVIYIYFFPIFFITEMTERQDQRREIMHSDGKVSNFGHIKVILFFFLGEEYPGSEAVGVAV